MYDDLVKMVAKLNKLIYLEMVKSENQQLKTGILNTIILDCEEIKNKHLKNDVKAGVSNEASDRQQADTN